MQKFYLQTTVVVISIAILEKFWHLKHQISKEIVYEDIVNIKPENYNLLKSRFRK